MKLQYTAEQLQAIYNYKVLKSRDCFLTYRMLINPKLKLNWYVIDLTKTLEQFVFDLEQGLRPYLIIQAPPQHGKSEAISDAISWIAGRNPDLKTIFASFSQRLGIRANLKLQRIYTKKVYKDIFVNTRINSKESITENTYLRNREILEYVDKDGYFRNTTVQGSVTGESLDLGVIDDPIKGRENANSETIRNKTWDWFTDDFLTRFSEYAGFLMILTRWHIDDPAGRLIEKYPKINVVTYKAIAEEDEEHRKIGEALFPEHKSLEFLNNIRSISNDTFTSLYQQSPTIKGGNLIKQEWFKWWKILPKLSYLIITVDTAQKTKEINDYTVMQCWGVSENKDIYLLDMIRDKFEAPQLRLNAKLFYNKWNNYKQNTINISLRKMYIEDKSSGSSLIQDLKQDKLKIGAVQRNRDKISRVMDFSPHIEAGKVYLNEEIKGVQDLISESLAFPNAKHDDTIDPMMDAIELTQLQDTKKFTSDML